MLVSRRQTRSNTYRYTYITHSRGRAHTIFDPSYYGCIRCIYIYIVYCGIVIKLGFKRFACIIDYENNICNDLLQYQIPRRFYFVWCWKFTMVLVWFLLHREINIIYFVWFAVEIHWKRSSQSHHNRYGQMWP